MNKELEKIPGVIWGFSQPIEDNMEEAVSGVKGELSVKIFGDDLRTLEAKGNEVVSVMSQDPRCAGSWTLPHHRPAQSHLRRRSARLRALWHQRCRCSGRHSNRRRRQYAVTQLLQGEAQYDVVLRYQQKYRDTREAIENMRLLSPSGERVSLAQLTKVVDRRRRRRDLSRRRVAIHCHQVQRARPRPWQHSRRSHQEGARPGDNSRRAITLDWAGEYKSKQRADARLAIITPITIMLIFMILYMMFHSFKWAMLIMVNVLLARVGGLWRFILRIPTSVSPRQ